MWRRRADATPAILAEWVSHQHYDAYWQRGSIAVDYKSIKCPVYVVDGWIDTYSNVIGRLLEHLTVPRKGLIGAWGHNYPDAVNPGPGLDWVYEEVRWWQQWLLGIDTGIMDEPMLRAYLPDATPWEVYPKDVPGRWVAEAVWPSPRLVPAVWHLNPAGKLSRQAAKPESVRYVADKIVGLDKLQWLPFPPSGMPGEQSRDDGNSLVFNSPPLESDIEILGYPIAKIRVASNVPVAKLAVRMTDVTPENKSWLVSYGLLNLTHRDSHEHPSALNARRILRRRPQVVHGCTPLQAGSSHSHRAVGEPVALGLAVAANRDADVRARQLLDRAAGAAGAASAKRHSRFPFCRRPRSPIAGLMGTPPRRYRASQPGRSADRQARVARVVVRRARGRHHPDPGGSELNEITEGDPNSCVWRQETVGGFKRGDWDCRTVARYEITSTAEAFLVKESLKLTNSGEIFFEQETVSKIGRNLL